MQSSFDKLYNFLKKVSVKDNSNITHTSMGYMKSSYSIDDNSYDEFINLYTESIKNGNTHSLVERPKYISPIIVDIDFKVYNENRKYNIDNIKKLIQIYYDTFLNLSTNAKNIDCITYVFEKDLPTYYKTVENNIRIYKDGFHLYFINVYFSIEDRELIYKKILENKNIRKIFSNIEHINNLNDVIDKSIIKSNGFLMYGSCKISREPYKLTYVFDNNLNQIDKSHLTIKDIIYSTSLRKFNISHDIIKLEIDKIKKDIVSIDNNLIYNETNNVCNIDFAKELLKILSPNRADNYNDWIRVCWAVSNIDKSLINDFLEFSKQCPEKYNERECYKYWNKTKPGLGIGTLCIWAEEDNHEKYLKARYKCLEYYTKRIINDPNDDYMAEYISGLYSHKFKCIQLLKNIQWYEFSNHRWVYCEAANTLVNIISSDVYNIIKNSPFIKNDLESTKISNEKKTEIISSLRHIKKKITNMPQKSNIMKSLAFKLYDQNFLKNLDENIYLLCFNNGVYDFKNDEFRKGYSDDNISLSVGYDYVTYKDTDKEILEIEKYFQQVIQDNEVRLYFLKMLSSYLIGKPDQKFIIWTGSGSNGKSLTINLLRSTLGDYFGTIDSSILTKKKKNSSNATPEIANKKGKRFIVIQEIESSENINVGYMKQLTGCDPIEVRELYKSPFILTPQFKMVLTCNRLPTLSSTDGGTIRRIRVIEWNSEFVENPIKKNQFKIDYNLSEKMKTWNQPFMWLLINKYRKLNVSEPDKIKLKTQEYITNCDAVYNFILECTVSDEECDESIIKLYKTYNLWVKYSERFKVYSKIDKNEFKNYFKDYKIVNDIVQNIRLIYN